MNGNKSNIQVRNGSNVPKYIFVTGGVMSGFGKGITTSSLAKILQRSGLDGRHA